MPNLICHYFLKLFWLALYLIRSKGRNSYQKSEMGHMSDVSQSVLLCLNGDLLKCDLHCKKCKKKDFVLLEGACGLQ